MLTKYEIAKIQKKENQIAENKRISTIVADLSWCEAGISKVAFFLQATTKSAAGTWKGTLSAKDQVALFGSFLGKGQILICAKENTISHFRKVCFGTDFERTSTLKISEI